MNKYDLKSLMELGQVEIARKGNHELNLTLAPDLIQD